MAKVDLVTIDAARINDVCRLYFLWKDLNTGIRSYVSRGINFPETLSEPMACYALGLKWNKGSGGDAMSDEGKLIEMKATSNFDSDLTSFGPVCHFDNLIFLRLNQYENKLYIYDTGIDAEELKTLPANKTETVGEQQKQKRRPHLSIIDTVIKLRDLQPTAILDIRTTQVEKF